jgi:hypothetical protein
MNKRSIPYWCHYHKDMNKDNKICCNCEAYEICYQEGDGEVLHSLCYNCYIGKLKLKKNIDTNHYQNGKSEAIKNEIKFLDYILTQLISAGIEFDTAWLKAEINLRKEDLNNE